MSKKPTIGLIIPPIEGHKKRGIGIYVKSLYREFQKIDNKNIFLAEYNSSFDKFDLIHYPYFDPFFLTIKTSKNSIITIHDLIPLKYPKYFPKGIKGYIKWQIQKYKAYKANAIITDSCASKKDIIDIIGIEQDKINVVPLGVDNKYKIVKDKLLREKVKNKYFLPDKFLLYTGDINYNKNIFGLLKVFKILSEKRDNIGLVLIGEGFVSQSIQSQKINKFINDSYLSNRVKILGYIPLDDLVVIYNLASIYLHLSYAEGFGLPILEAMSCGLPVISSDTASISEISSDASIMLNPNNHQDIVRNIFALLDNYNFRNNLMHKGLINAKKYSWYKCALNTYEIYNKIIFQKL